MFTWMFLQVNYLVLPSEAVQGWRQRHVLGVPEFSPFFSQMSFADAAVEPSFAILKP